MKNIKYIAAAFLFSGMVYAQNIDINAMPKPGPTPAINIAKPNSFKLKNGLTVLIVENNKLPRVNIRLTIGRPPVYEGNIVGVGEIMADQLGMGTTKLSKEEFNKKIDFLGAYLSFSSEGAGANTLSKYSTQVISLMADAVVNPKFSAEEVNKSKERTIEGLKTKEKDAGEIARRVDNALTYGKNTALGEFVTEESINRIQLKDVQDFYKKYYAPDNAYLVIVGDVKTSEIKKLVEKEFGKWKKSGTKFAAVEPTKNLPATEINIVDVPTAVQSVIRVGNISTLQMKDPQYFSGVIANYILGGGGEARLFMNLREKNGYTYGAYSRLSTSKYSPSFTANASVRNEVTDKAVVEFMNELKGISQIKPEELANAKAKLKGEFIMSLEKPETIARFALNERLYSLPADFYANYLKSIDKVTTSDVSAAAKAYILPNQSRIFVAGKGAEIAEGVFIDHGSGLVIGETAIVEKGVMLYHGVTLGGTGKETGKRHPTIRQGALISAHSQVIGPVEVGPGAKVGAGAVVVSDVPADVTVVGVPAKVVRIHGQKDETAIHEIEENREYYLKKLEEAKEASFHSSGL